MLRYNCGSKKYGVLSQNGAERMEDWNADKLTRRVALQSVHDAEQGELST